ncbi:MAG: substrate-binding domain-containing protein [Mycobacterium sp.]
MGRHSVPDPEDSSDAEPNGQPPGGQPPQYPGGERYFDDPAGGSDDDGYETDDYDDGYDEADYDDADYDEPGFGAPGQSADHWQPDPGPYPDDDYSYLGQPEAATHAFASSPPPPDRPSAAGPQHGGEWDGGEWTGSHRAIKTGRRGVSVSVIVALVTVVVVVGGVILWRFLGDALSHRSQAGAARCVSGDVAVAVVVDPSIADQIGPLADKYNQTADPVGDKCVKVGVKSADSDQVVNGFTGSWPSDLGEQPALWIPGSSVSAARLEASTGEKTVSTSRSLVTSPVMLAVRPQLKNALAKENWATLPGLQNNPTSLEALDLPGWGSLRLALPLSGDSDATYLAAEAVAAASAPQKAPATSGANAVTALMSGQPKLADTKASTAMDALVQADDPASAPVHAVVATEQQIYQRGSSLSDASDKLASWLPPGPIATADYPAVLLSGPWLSQEQVSAASEFERFLRKPEALAELAKAGFRSNGAELPKSDVTDFGKLSEPLSVGDDTVRTTLANLVSTPAQNPAVTILLDQSMTVNEGGDSRVANVASALSARLKALPPSSEVGLWTFDGVAGRSEVSRGPLDEPVGGQPRSSVLASNLNGQVASNGGAVSFTTLRLVYTDAVANFIEGQPNSVLVITAGPHTDQSLDGAGLQDFIRQTFNQGKPVAVNVIDFGGDPDRATWEAVAQTTGGDYQNLTSSAAPELTTTLATMLG